MLPGCAYIDKNWRFSSAAGVPASDPGLGKLALRTGRQYGAAVQSWQLNEPDFADALLREATMLVPERELKWDVLQPTQDTYDFSGYSRIADFAQKNRLDMRGHVLVWHHANPDWLAPELMRSRSRAEKILQTHIERVLEETSPHVKNWDVVNEAVDWYSKREDGLRQSVWLRALGPEYVALAFHMAHKANPDLTLTYNDYGMEQDTSEGRRKRQGILRLLERCRREKVPIHSFGLQSHLLANRPLAKAEFTDFLKGIRGMGLKIVITELDLNATRLSGRADDRLKIAQNYVRTYLDLVQKDEPVETLLTWGLTDRYTWLSKRNPEISGVLPLDGDYNRGPLWETLKEEWLSRGS